ncbi:MAG: heavy metal-associated domain-containing protein, partial [Candidatus Doudnabacteria bacterium]|nr:heavy metal-associated domain-containing protein [Candidatus Doudnabacteria bacterium]
MSEIRKTFDIKGMHCASCVNVLERSLRKVPGVLKATVNLATEKATINYNPAVATAEHLASAVSKVGYQAILDNAQSEGQL